MALPIDLSPVTALASAETLIVRPLFDAGLDLHGHDPRSSYVELFWLGVLGPSSILLLRRLAAGFDAWPDGFEIDVHETADALGLAAGQRHSAFTRTVQRIVQFGMARRADDGIAVRRRLPTLSPRHLQRLPASIRDTHRDWMAADVAETTGQREHQRAHSVALGLLEAGDEPTIVEGHLHALGISRRTASQAVEWAQTRLRHPTATWDGPDAA